MAHTARHSFEMNDSVHPRNSFFALRDCSHPFSCSFSTFSQDFASSGRLIHSSSPVPPHSLGIPCGPGEQSSSAAAPPVDHPPGHLCPQTASSWMSPSVLPKLHCLTSTCCQLEGGVDSPSLPISPAAISSGLKSPPLIALCTALEQVLAISCLSYSKFLTGILAWGSLVHSVAKCLFWNTSLISFSPWKPSLAVHRLPDSSSDWVLQAPDGEACSPAPCSPLHALIIFSSSWLFQRTELLFAWYLQCCFLHWEPTSGRFSLNCYFCTLVDLKTWCSEHVIFFRHSFLRLRPVSKERPTSWGWGLLTVLKQTMPAAPFLASFAPVHGHSPWSIFSWL